MRQEEFIKVLDGEGYSYEIKGDKLVVTVLGDVDLQSLTSLPPGVVFKNVGHVYLSALTSIPPGVEFKNVGRVYLESLTSIPPGVEFRNKGSVNLSYLTGGWVDEWSGNIKYIYSKSLLNLMIKRGMFI